MSSEEIPQPVRQLLSEHIESVGQVEVLLLLHAQPSRSFAATEVANQLRVDPAWVESQLDNLCERGMLSCSDTPPRRYRYAPRKGEADRAVAGLAKEYADRRVSIINLIYRQQARI